VRETIVPGTLDGALEVVDQQLDHAGTPPDVDGLSTRDDVTAKAPQFARFTPTQVSAERGFDHLYAVKLEAEAVLGQAALSVDEMLNLGVGSVIELDRLVSEPVDLLVQNVRVARGEVVVLNDHFAIRITEILGANP
jgi:flagellar motor switch protein FliN/FliY